MNLEYAPSSGYLKRENYCWIPNWYHDVKEGRSTSVGLTGPDSFSARRPNSFLCCSALTHPSSIVSNSLCAVEAKEQQKQFLHDDDNGTITTATNLLFFCIFAQNTAIHIQFIDIACQLVLLGTQIVNKVWTSIVVARMISNKIIESTTINRTVTLGFGQRPIQNSTKALCIRMPLNDRIVTVVLHHVMRRMVKK